MKVINADCLEILPTLQKESFDLVIADPPYFKVVNEKWDYQWHTENDYIDWCVRWFSEIYRLLRYGGTFYLFGYFRTLALLVSKLLELGFDLRQQIIINKGIKAIAGRATKNYKMFPNVNVLDPFAGSCITGFVCDNLKRNSTLIEKEKGFLVGIV